MTRQLRRFLTPASVVFAVALVLSLGVHVPIYGALGVLAWLMKVHDSEVAGRPIEVQFEVSGAPAAPNEPAPRQGQAEPEQERAESETEQREERQQPQQRRAQAPVRPEPPRPEQREPEKRAEPPYTIDRRQAITQRSDNPNVQPPPDARYIARESRRVEQETVARIRNYQRDDTEPNPGAPRNGPTPDPGNDDRQATADLREREGSDERAPTPEEAQAPRPVHAPVTPPPREVASGDNTARGPRTPAAGERPPGMEGGGETPLRTVTITDGAGSFTVAVPRERPVGVGPGQAGGITRPGARARGSTGRGGQGGQGRGHGVTGPDDLRVSWSIFEETYTEEQLRRDREAYIQERRSRARGSSRQERWQAFRAAIENFVPNVRPGNQTALNAAASPFAEYLAEVHRRLHREFADRFLASLPADGGPLADPTLMTMLEIIMNRDGTVHRVGVVQTSGFLPFDYGAFSSVMRGQPYPAAPAQILSGDGRVYMHWGFYRNERQCGTFNAEPYILPHPPSMGPRPRGPLQDRPEPGGVIPSRARPAGDGSGLPQQSDAVGPQPSDATRAPAPAGSPRPSRQPSQPSQPTQPQRRREPARPAPSSPWRSVPPAQQTPPTMG